MFREAGLVTYDGMPIQYSMGDSTTVDFDFFKLWRLKDTIADFEASKLHYYHTHQSLRNYSSQDRKMIAGHSKSWGFPIFFSIILFDDDHIDNVEHEMLTFRYKDDDVVYIDNILMVGLRQTLDISELLVLKGISYAWEPTKPQLEKSPSLDLVR